MNRKSIFILLIFGMIALLALTACAGSSPPSEGEQTEEEHEGPHGRAHRTGRIR
jgi:hypothetical protein